MTQSYAATVGAAPRLGAIGPREPRRRRVRFAPLGFLRSLHQAWQCEACYRSLAGLSDEALQRLGIARAEIPRLAARLSGLLPDDPASRGAGRQLSA